MDLSGRRYLVTGASSGIGRETAVLLSQLGAAVVLSGRDSAKLEETLSRLEGTGHSACAFDLTELDAIPDWLKRLASAHGAFDGLVHSAGMHSAMPLRFITPAALDQMMRVNFHSAVMLARGFRQKQCHSPGTGSVVFLTSVAGLVGEGGVAGYSASKAAIVGLTRSLAVELAGEGIRVNAVAPGFVESEMSDRLKQSLTPEQFAVVKNNHLLGTGKVRDVANSIAFLLGDTARWITGTALVVDGGYTAH